MKGVTVARTQQWSPSLRRFFTSAVQLQDRTRPSIFPMTGRPALPKCSAFCLQFRRPPYCANTFPGFMMFFGSSARLMLRIIPTAPAPASSSR